MQVAHVVMKIFNYNYIVDLQVLGYKSRLDIQRSPRINTN